jgi:hypothetical protein
VTDEQYGGELLARPGSLEVKIELAESPMGGTRL